jgi:hypothetical protein
MNWRPFCDLGLTLLAAAGCLVVVYCAVNRDSPRPKPAVLTPVDPQDAVLNQPWPVLSDGRLLLDIYGEKIAIPNCPECRTSYFRVFLLDDPVRHMDDMEVGEAIQHPAKLRRLLANGAFFVYDTGNSTILKGGYLDHFDRHTIPLGDLFQLAIHRTAFPMSSCPFMKLSLMGRHCDQLRALETEPESGDISGFARLELFSYMPPGDLQNFVYVARHPRYRDALGIPLFFHCGENAILRLRGCSNGDPFSGTGFFLKRNISFRYSFRLPPGEPEMRQMLDTFDAMRNAMEYLIVTDKSPELHHEH